MNLQAPIRLGWRNKIDPNRILFLRASSNYTEVFLDNGNRIISATTLGSLAKRLPAYQFIRASSSALVNLAFVVSYEKTSSSIRLANDITIHVSRRRTKEVRSSIEQ